MSRWITCSRPQLRLHEPPPFFLLLLLALPGDDGFRCPFAGPDWREGEVARCPVALGWCACCSNSVALALELTECGFARGYPALLDASPGTTLRLDRWALRKPIRAAAVGGAILVCVRVLDWDRFIDLALPYKRGAHRPGGYDMHARI